MPGSLSRRRLIAGGFAFALSSAASAARAQSAFSEGRANGEGIFAADGQYFDAALLPPPESDVDYPIESINARLIKKQFRRQTVLYSEPERPGTIIVDPGNRFLYQVLEGNRAIRYGVGVGRAGFSWSGEAVVGLKRRWPRWVPPREMVDRDGNARKWVNGQPGGPGNPLGARALYLFQGNVDTLYRIHGTSQPETIGTAVSSGCVRMTNPDVADLYERVPIGARVIVLPASASVAEGELPASANAAEGEPERTGGFLLDRLFSRDRR